MQISFLIHIVSIFYLIDHVVSTRIQVSSEESLKPCENCLLFSSLPEALEFSFQSKHSVTMEIMDSTYKINKQKIEIFFQAFANRSLKFSSNPSVFEKKISILLF